ncbi:hypothetical protein [Acholeplasma hippikon]|uniref:Uncharacterized protein n=1 Tax=Acholeplasma hippikon TaxID=264636 RepID=A0A449BLD2_9MOLU|nr:hypothetical protein [Acholeplasma hippikon]VEU83247.1 Uncharacterised protein [Acholeplasma hippikon]
MFSFLLRAKEEDIIKAKEASKEFWEYFIKEEIDIVQRLSHGGEQTMRLLDEIEGKLRLIFPKYKKELHFGFLIEQKEFDLAHANNKYLKELMRVFRDEMPMILKQTWTLNLTE